MRLPRSLAQLMLCTLCACNPFITDKDSEQARDKTDSKVKDAKFQKLRRERDTLLEMHQKKLKQKGLDTLKPKRA